MKNKWVIWMSAALCAFFLTSCKGEDGGSGTLSTASPMVANFDPSQSVIPFPSNLLFSGSVDGTLNIPVVSATDFTDPKVAMNALDGFSTVASMSTSFSLPISNASVGTGVRVFEVATAGVLKSYAVTGITAELVSGVDFAALPSPTDATILVIKPLKPLKSNTNYMITVSNILAATTGQKAVASKVFTLLKQTTALVDAAGTSLVPGVTNASAVQLEGLRQLSNAMILNVDTYAVANGVTQLPRADIALVWSFKTQTIGKTLAAIQTASATDPYATNAANFITVPAIPAAATGGLGVLDSYSFAVANNIVDIYTAGAFTNIASVVIGAAKLPYYLDEYTAANPLGPITGHFQIDAYGMPALKSVQTVPFLMTVPNALKAGGWPVVIFQHGFTVDKSAMFGIANTLAKAGFATIAIDSVLHGSRTFNIDLLSETTDSYGNVSVTANAPDGKADSSGRHYLNLSYLLTTRDNARQSVADLIHLIRLLETKKAALDLVNNNTGLLPPDGIPDLNISIASPLSFVGHSNGGILGTMLASVDPYVKTIVLANAGAGYGGIFQNSIEVSSLINAGLAAKGIAVGSVDYYSFLAAAQTVGDDSDPINYGITYNNWITADVKKVFVLKTTPDKVVPNSATNTLISILGPLTQVGITAANSPLLGGGYVNYISGNHSTFLRPAGVTNPVEFLAAYTEMQTATATFLSSALLGAAQVTVTTADPTIVE